MVMGVPFFVNATGTLYNELAKFRTSDKSYAKDVN